MPESTGSSKPQTVVPQTPDPQTAQILAARGERNAVDERVPYGFFVEPEFGRCGTVVDVATLLLTNRECPFHCLMCDLWQNTTTHSVSVGAIPGQIEYALQRLPPAQRIKLYNSGNFFDRRAIATEDHKRIAQLVQPFETVIIENHPKLTDESCLRFRDSISGELEIALGLETVHPDVLPRLNKQMTLDDFARATEFLVANGITVRTFILLRPPWLSEQHGVDWAIRSIEFALDLGVDCCAVVPTRAGNGIMEQLQADGDFSSPIMASMETVMGQAISKGRGRILMDLWDAKRFSQCDHCVDDRIDRLRTMNLTQTVLPSIECSSCGEQAQ